MEAVENVTRGNRKLLSIFIKAFMIILIISYFLRDTLGLRIPVSIFIILYTAGFIILRRKELIEFYMFLIPLSNGPILYYLNVCFGIMFLLKSIKYVKINHAVMVGFILVLWESFHLLPNTFVGYNESIIKLLGFTLCLIVTTIIISNKDLKYNYVSMVHSWCIGFASFCVILLLKYVYNFGFGNLSTTIRRFGVIPASLYTTSTSLFINPNDLGKLAVLTVFCLFTLLKFEKENKFKVSFLVIYFLVFGLMSGSRAFALALAILMLLYVLDMLLKFQRNKREIAAFSVIFIVGVFFVLNYMEPYLEIFKSRMLSGDISGSRFKIYKEYLQILISSPYLIVGAGMQDYIVKFGTSWSTHNFFLEILCIWGIIGLAIVSVWFLCLYKSLRVKSKIREITVLPYLPLVSLFLFAQFGQFFISYYKVFPTLILGFLNIKYSDMMISLDKIK